MVTLLREDPRCCAKYVFKLLIVSRHRVYLQPHVLKLERLALDTRGRRRDPVRDLSWLEHRIHQTPHVFAILHRRQPLSSPPLKLFTRNQIAFNIKRVSSVFSDVPVETRMRKEKPLAHTFIREHFVPAREPFLTVFHILATKHFIQCVSQRHFTRFKLTILHDGQCESLVRGCVFGVLLAFLVTTLQSRGEEVSGVRTDLAAEKIEGVAEPEVDVLLNNVERNATELTDIALLHQLRRAPDNTAQASVSDEHVMRFFGEHELARSSQWFETGFRQSRKLILAVAIGEHREGEEV